MAQSQSGKWVSKVAATGGGRSYAKQRPTNFYAAIAVIVVLGLVSIFFARAEFQSNHGTTTTTKSAVKPAVGTTSYASLATDVCGALQASLPPQPTTSKSPLLVQDYGLVKVAPTNASQAGANASVALLAANYPGLTVTSSKLALPATPSSSAVTYTNGEACPAGTPDAGKKGQVAISYWPSFASTTPTVTTNPAAVHFTENSLMTIAFVPQGAKILKPSGATIQKMLIATQTAPTTATTAPVTTTTTPVLSTTTTAPKG